MRLVILGGSGAGKSTQAQRLCKHFDLPLISEREILRGAIACLNNTGWLARFDLETKELVPDEMIIEFMRVRLKQADASRGWVLEGYPRTAVQAEELDFLLEALDQQLTWAVYLQVPQAVMVSRALGRSLPDEQPEIVQRRVELFYDRTIPVLEYYDRRRRLLTVNGDQPPEIVQYNIVNFLSVF